MDYEAFFRTQIDNLKREGRYRVFADLERGAGSFPGQSTTTSATGKFTKSRSGAATTISAWASIPSCWTPCARRSDTCGAGAGGTRNISGTNHCHVLLERELADLHGKEAALLFTSGYVSNEATLQHPGHAAAGLRDLFRRAEPRLDDRRHPPFRRGEARSSATTTWHISRSCWPRRPPTGRSWWRSRSVYSMDGDIAPIGEICDVAETLRRA